MSLRWGVVSTSPNLQAEGPPLVGCPWLLIQYIHSCPLCWRPFLRPQRKDAPCRGDRDRLVAADPNYMAQFVCIRYCAMRAGHCAVCTVFCGTHKQWPNVVVKCMTPLLLSGFLGSKPQSRNLQSWLGLLLVFLISSRHSEIFPQIGRTHFLLHPNSLFITYCASHQGKWDWWVMWHVCIQGFGWETWGKETTWKN